MGTGEGPSPRLAEIPSQHGLLDCWLACDASAKQNPVHTTLHVHANARSLPAMGTPQAWQMVEAGGQAKEGGQFTCPQHDAPDDTVSPRSPSHFPPPERYTQTHRNEAIHGVRGQRPSRRRIRRWRRRGRLSNAAPTASTIPRASRFARRP